MNERRAAMLQCSTEMPLKDSVGRVLSALVGLGG